MIKLYSKPTVNGLFIMHLTLFSLFNALVYAGGSFQGLGELLTGSDSSRATDISGNG